jgi:hypothetical protein
LRFLHFKVLATQVGGDQQRLTPYFFGMGFFPFFPLLALGESVLTNANEP